MRLLLLVLALLVPLVSVTTVSAQEPSSTQAPSVDDAGAYLDLLERTKQSSVEDQISSWRQFLEDHPETSFRGEIERNLRNLENLLTQTDPTRRKEEVDATRYLKAVEFAKKLSLQDQVALWEQFIEENPKSLYRREAETNLRTLRAKLGSQPSSPVAPRVEANSPEKVGADDTRVAKRLAYKDKQKATLLAIFPGLVVPGIAHWYTRDYVIAGVLTGARLGGLAVGLPGILKNERSLIVVGSVLAAFSYLVDIVDAPFAVDRYNEALEAQEKKTSMLNGEGAPSLSVAWTFHF